MEYTKNIGNKLKLIGFNLELDSNNLPKEDIDNNLHYEIWKRGLVEVTVEHSPGKVVIVDLPGYVDAVKVRNLNELKILDRFMNK